MELKKKLSILADAAKYDASCASSGSYRKRPAQGIGNTEGMGICHSFTPDGRCVSLLKILLTNYCVFDCLYCINRISSNVPRARFTPQEVVTLTLEFYKRNYIEGLFLSSGIIQNPDYTMEQLVEVGRALREDHGFGGYIHLKAVPGASAELVEQAGRWADRLSANIELPTDADLASLAPAKTHQSIEEMMSEIKERLDEGEAYAKTTKGRNVHSLEERAQKRKGTFAPAGQTTQMIIGATQSSDRVILQKASALYQTHKLRRIYYSAFSPIQDAAPTVSSSGGSLLGALLPGSSLRSPVPLTRENRLYQADWLFRFYEFSLDELTSEQEQHLSLAVDPKLSWALNHKEFFPVDLNKATRFQLLRVPGFGVKTVEKILRMRKFSSVTLGDLVKLRVPLSRARYFITTTEKNSALSSLSSLTINHFVEPVQEQLELFPESTYQMKKQGPMKTTGSTIEEVVSVISGEL